MVNLGVRLNGWLVPRKFVSSTTQQSPFGKRTGIWIPFLYLTTPLSVSRLDNGWEGRKKEKRGRKRGPHRSPINIGTFFNLILSWSGSLDYYVIDKHSSMFYRILMKSHKNWLYLKYRSIYFCLYILRTKIYKITLYLLFVWIFAHWTTQKKINLSGHIRCGSQFYVLKWSWGLRGR